jgi:hypothetical protein
MTSLETPDYLNSLDSIILKLKKNPLFYVSQASKELFHSNFWEWLAEINICETVQIFSDKIELDNVLRCKREHNQKFKVVAGEDIKSKNDFVIFKSNGKKEEPVVVIENKVKDFPYQEQLQRIKNSFNDDRIQYILVSLFWQEKLKFEGW